jgi:hypothetical protein
MARTQSPKVGRTLIIKRTLSAEEFGIYDQHATVLTKSTRCLECLERLTTLSGLGIALQSVWHIEEDLKTGRLQRVLPEFSADAAIYTIMPGRRQVPARVRLFIRFFQEQLSTNTWGRMTGLAW